MKCQNRDKLYIEWETLIDATFTDKELSSEVNKTEKAVFVDQTGFLHFLPTDKRIMICLREETVIHVRCEYSYSDKFLSEMGMFEWFN